MKKINEIVANNKSIYFIAIVYTLVVSAGVFLQGQRLLFAVITIAVLPLFLYAILFRFYLLGISFVLLIPLSIKLMIGNSIVSFPGEALVLVLALVYIAYSLNSGSVNISKIWRHPVTILILIDLAWSLFTGLIGELPLISVKRILVKATFVIVFYFLFIKLFKQKENIYKIWLLYGIGLIVPILWTLFNHSRYDYSKVVSFVMPLPFYNDHTLYAACIAFVIPVFIFVLIKPKWYGLNRQWSLLVLAICIILIIGEYFSYSRAAWISIVVSLLAGLMIVFLRFRIFHFLVIILIGTAVLSYYSQDFYQRIEKVDDVSRKETIEQHLRSVMNIQSDASNLERINRWQCALRMFRDKPLTGFGPGTYQFVYAKYQVTSEMTRISTNHGEKGNAHSEYLMYLSETGVIGLLIFISMIFIVGSKAIRIYNTHHDKELKWLILAILLGLLSFLIHGTFNSFIDTDKAAILFYASVSAIVAVEVYHSNKIPGN